MMLVGICTTFPSDAFAMGPSFSAVWLKRLELGWLPGHASRPGGGPLDPAVKTP